MALVQPKAGNRSPSNFTMAERTEGRSGPGQVHGPVLPYQDFLENPHIDQERRVVEAGPRGDQEEEPVDLQVQEIREAKQRFLQKLAN